MRLRTVQLENYRRYRSAQLEFPDGLVSVIGQNGAGKSTLLEAVAWALFGNQAEIVRTDKESIKRQGTSHTEQCMVRVEFDFEDENFVVERSMKGKNLTMSAAMYAGDNILARGAEEVSAAVIKLFGMDHKAFFISVFARQKELNALTSLPKGERKKMVLRLLGIESIDGAIKRIREDAKAANMAIEGARKELVAPDGGSAIGNMEKGLGELEREVKNLSGSRSGAEAELRKTEKVLKKLRTELSSQERLAKERDALLSKKAAADSRVSELGKQSKALAKDLEALSELEEKHMAAEAKSGKAARELEKIMEKKREAGEERDGIRSEMASLKAGIGQLEKEMGEIEENMSEISDMGPDSDCPTCKRRLGRTYEALLAAFRGQLDERRESAGRKATSLSEFEAKLGDCDARSEALAKREARLREKVKAFEVLKARVERGVGLRKRLAETGNRLSASRVEQEEIAEALDAIKFDQKGYDKARKAMDDLNLEIRGTEKRMMAVETEMARLEERRKHLAKELERLNALRASYEEKRVQAENLAVLGQVMGEFRTHLISRIRPALATMSSELMGVLTEGRYNEMELSEDYEITIRDAGEFHDLERFSGGEKDLANLCLRLAISDIIATRHGTNSFDMIVLDEIFGSQDSNRKRNLLSSLNGLSNRFKQIFLITHVEDIKELMGNVILVSENPDGSSRAEAVR